MDIATGTDLLLAEVTGSVATITFNDPKRHNVLSMPMQEAIVPTVAALEADPEVRAIVIRGAGDRAFVAGADISEFAEKRTGSAEDRAEYDRQASRTWSCWDEVTKPIIALIDGYCIGGGLLLALHADIRFCSDRSTFAIPAARLGLGYSRSGVKRLLRVATPAVAGELLFSARRISAAEALTHGLVNRVIPAEELHETVYDFARDVAKKAPLTIRAAKAAIQYETGIGDHSAEVVDELVNACFSSEDYREGQAAFLAKREPEFRGQ